MFANRLLVGFIALGVLIAGYLLVPRRDEQVAMLTRDGHYEMAARELSAIQDGGDHRPHVLMQSYLLKEVQGDPVGALRDLDAILTQRPRDTAARKRQAELLLQTGQLERYLESLALVVEGHPGHEQGSGAGS